MRKIVFTSDDLPAQLDDQARFSVYRDQYTALYGSCNFSRNEDRPFRVRFEFAPFGAVGLGRFEGTISRIARTMHDVATDAADNFCIGLNRAQSPLRTIQNGRESTVARGGAVLLSNAEAGDIRSMTESSWFTLNVARSQLLDLVDRAEDLIAAPLDPASEAMRHLRRYVGILLRPDGIQNDPTLIDHVGRTLLDLIALALGAGRDTAEVARMRGLRAARLQEVLAQIRAGFADPAFSPGRLALRVGLSARYIQDLSHDTGASLTERVLELRLQKARSLLTGRQAVHMKISEIAYASGFNEVSYFNQAFRRRFGATPTQFRSGRVV